MVRLSLFFFVVLFANGQTKTEKLPDGKGKDVVKKICSSCHDIGTVIMTRRTKIGWEQKVDDMVSRGAEGTDEQMDTVVAYLTQFFGKINVNTASAAELQSVLGLSDKEAQAVIAYKQQNGNFKGFDELMKVPGSVGEKLQAKKSQIAFSL